MVIWGPFVDDVRTKLIQYELGLTKLN